MKAIMRRILLVIAIVYIGFVGFIVVTGLINVHQKWEIPISPTMASIMFTASTVMIGIALTFIVATWRLLKKVTTATTVGTPRVIFRLGGIKDKRTKYEMEFRGILVFVMFMLGISILCNLVALQAIVGTMLNFPTALSSSDDLKAGAWLILFSTMFFMTGIFFGGMLYAVEGIRYIRGKPSFLSDESTPTTEQISNN